MNGKQQCFHCGKPVPDGSKHTVDIDGKTRHLCSADCERVVRLIVDRGLTRFYQFRDGPVATGDSQDALVERWASYDRPALQREFVTGLPDGTRRAQLLLQGVRCAACAWLIENALATVPGLISIGVDPVTTRTSIHWDPQRLKLSELLARLAQLGYTPYPYTEDASEQAAAQEHRAALKRLIVAGLGMMQVMSFAVAMYAGAWRDPEIQQFLRLISLLVATPVVFYAGAPFFSGAWHRLRGGGLSMDVPVALAIGGAWAASVWHTLTGHGEVYFDSATMFVFFLSAARFLEMSGRHRALSLTGALARHLPRVATRVVDGRAEEVGAMELQPGDIVLVQPGRTVPADGVLLDSPARLNESLLTGESTPVAKRPGDDVVAGSVSDTDALKLQVTRVGTDTVMAQISQLIGSASERKPQLVQTADRVASWFVAGVLIIAALVGVIWWQLAPERAFEVVLAVLVVTCPCALALATPAAFTVATAALSRQGFMVRRPGALQALAHVTDMVFDKTGTLTEHDAGIGSIETFGAMTQDEALAVAAALEARSEHPLARAFPEPAEGELARAVQARPGAGLEGEFRGHRWRIGQLAFVAELAGAKPAPATAVDDSQDIKSIFLGNERGLVARFQIAERLRPGTVEAFRSLGALGLHKLIASGDQPGAVKAIAIRLGADDWRAGMTPDEKLSFIHELQRSGKRVAMLGDGINDAPVLAGADVSIAMGSGTSLAQYSADCVLINPSLRVLPGAVRKARSTVRVIRQNLAWAVVYNLIALPLAGTGMLAPWMAALGMSASSLLVVGNALRLGGRVKATAEATGTAVAPEPATKSCCKSSTAGAAAR